VSQSFTLQPWEPISRNLALTGSIQRTGNQLQIQYQLAGDVETVAIPAPHPPQRRFELWEATCFEFFLAPTDAEHYWEFNLSPSGDWNVFRLDGYRSGLRDETTFETLPFQVTQREGWLELELAIDLSRILEPNQDAIAAITTVLQDRSRSVSGRESGTMSYWALCHNGKEADFHRRDGFTVSLPGES
jgi:hypothetical protein